jgi:hypothetical protein
MRCALLCLLAVMYGSYSLATQDGSGVIRAGGIIGACSILARIGWL